MDGIEIAIPQLKFSKTLDPRKYYKKKAFFCIAYPGDSKFEL